MTLLDMAVEKIMQKHAGALGVFVAVALVTAYPPFMSMLDEGLLGAFRYFAADSFYYLSVADHSVGAPFFTFDGTHPTNGFHPLWQIYLERSFSSLAFSAAEQIQYTAISSVLFVSLGTGLFALALLHLTRRPALALLGSAPGVYYLLMPVFDPHQGSQWSFANGMETPFSIFLFGVLAYAIFVRKSLSENAGIRSLVWTSGILTLLTLARLDDIFIFVPFLLFVAATGSSRQDTIKRVAVASVVPSLLIGGYLLYNLASVGSLLPSSGSAKAQPLWALARNFYALLTTTLPFADPLGRSHSAWASEAWRTSQMLVPALAAAGWLLTQRIRIHSLNPRILQNTGIGLLASYAILKSTYNFTVVSLWDQGHWYYPLCIMTFNLIVVVWCGRLLDDRATRTDESTEGSPLSALAARFPALGRIPFASLAALGLVLVSANAFVDMKAQGRHQSRSFEFWVERGATELQIEKVCPGCGLLAFDDGIVSYSLTETPTLNGLGLVLDRDANSAREKGKLLDVAWKRGHRLLVSVNYEMPQTAYESRANLRAHLAQNIHLRDVDLDAWDFDVAFQSATTGVSFVRFEPRSADTAKAERAEERRRAEKARPRDLPKQQARRHQDQPSLTGDLG
jgi:hypothetical protein